MAIVPIIRSLRPRQWTKNGVIFIGLVFALKLRQMDLVLLAGAAFGLFCLLSGGVYLLNDLIDVERDRAHPTKRLRPVASGTLSRPLAIAVAVAIPAICLPVAYWLQPAFGLAATAYFLLNVAYTLALKHIVIIDVFSIAAGFVLRVVAGAVVINVPVSPWLYLCTILGALFLGFSKRRHELVLLAGGAGEHRSILEEYSPNLLDQMIAVVTSSCCMPLSACWN
jgi:4-hydroxybenzoate polyprenyltransferase